MRHFTLFLFLLTRLAPSAWGETAAAPKSEPMLAVMDILNNTGEFGSFVEGMPDMLITELMESGEVKLVERTKVQTAMKALKMETSGLTQERNLELGKWLGVDGILFGAFNRAGDQYRLDVRSIDVQTGKINVAASTTCGKLDILNLIPEIGKQLRVKLRAYATGKVILPLTAPIANIINRPPQDSCPLLIQYKMIVTLFSQDAIPLQRVRIYLDNRLLGTSGVVSGLNRYFTLFGGKIPVGSHSLTLIHGSVDRQGRWVRELSNQPDAFAFDAYKGSSPAIQYRMHAHDGWFSFQDFKLNSNNPNPNQGE